MPIGWRFSQRPVDGHRRSPVQAGYGPPYHSFASVLEGEVVIDERRRQVDVVAVAVGVDGLRSEYESNRKARQTPPPPRVRQRRRNGGRRRAIRSLRRVPSSFLNSSDFSSMPLLRVLAHLLRQLHAAELRAAHRAEVRHLGAVGRQRLVVVGARGHRIERQVELILPAELEPRLRQRIVPLAARAGGPSPDRRRARRSCRR